MSNLRTVTVYGTRGKVTKIDTDVQSWGELKTLLAKEGVPFDNIKYTENVNKATLEHTDAVLPTVDFVLFGRAVKTKSGLNVEGLSYKDMKALVAEHGEDCKQFLNEFVETKDNWTRLSSSELRAGLEAFQPVGAEVVEEAIEEVTEVADTVEETVNEAPATPLEKAKEVKQLLSEICEEVDDIDVCDRIDDLKDDTDGLIADLEEIYDADAIAQREEEARLAKEREEAEAAEKAELESQRDAFMEGFDN